jgi:hypothetical protein
MTDHALNHRFRKVRATVSIIHAAREQGLDVKDLTTDENLLPTTQGAIDKNSTTPRLIAYFSDNAMILSCYELSLTRSP